MRSDGSSPSDKYRAYYAEFRSLLELPFFSEAADFVQTLNDKMQQVMRAAFCALNERLDEIPLDEVIDKIGELGTDIERGFNIAAVVPMLGTLTSAVRVTAGKIQFLAGAIFVSLAESIYFIASQIGVDRRFLIAMRLLSALGMEFMIHGALNTIRGAGELLLGTCTLGFGSVALIIPNMIHYRNFTPYFAYGTLVNEYRTYLQGREKTETSQPLLSIPLRDWAKINATLSAGCDTPSAAPVSSEIGNTIPSSSVAASRASRSVENAAFIFAQSLNPQLRSDGLNR